VLLVDVRVGMAKRLMEIDGTNNFFKNMVVSVLGGFRALEWALQKVVWQIERNF